MMMMMVILTKKVLGFPREIDFGRPECPFAVIGVWPKWSQTEHPLSETTGQGVPAKMGGTDLSNTADIQNNNTNTPILRYKYT